MKHHRFGLALLPLVLIAALALTACGASDPSPAASPAQPSGSASAQDSLPTLQELCGDDYAAYIEDTILMQMENRMADKNPEIEYFPIAEEKPLSDYVVVDDTLTYTLDDKGNPVIHLPAGTVTDESHGEQTFAVPKLPK